jgi:hypothetical protein
MDLTSQFSVPLLLTGQRQLLSTGFLGRHEDLDLGEREGQKAETCNNRLRTGKGYGVASAMRLSWTRPP